MDKEFQIRIFDPTTDYDMVRGWWESHEKMSPIPASMLPKLGIVISRNGEDEAALWLYMDNSVGVCFVEYPVTRPKLGLAKSKKAFVEGIDFLKAQAREFGYGVMLVRTLPAIARILAKEGFVKGGEGLVCMASLTTAKEGSSQNNGR